MKGRETGRGGEERAGAGSDCPPPILNFWIRQWGQWGTIVHSAAFMTGSNKLKINMSYRITIRKVFLPQSRLKVK